MTHALHIQATRDYDKFELLPFNRDTKNLKTLEESFRKFGWIPAHPLHVVINGSGKLGIKDGHHRFVVAKLLGIPILYVVCQDDASLFVLARTTNPWLMEDYLQGYLRVGKAAYAVVREYRERTGIPLGLSVALLAGNTATSNYTRAFKDGTFKVSDSPLAETVAEIVGVCKTVSVVATHTLFVQALARCVFVPEFNPDRFKKKMRSHGSILTRQATVDAYSRLIEEIYNWKAPRREVVALSFMADVAAKERRPATPTSSAPKR
jgi:hypothetical protein